MNRRTFNKLIMVTPCLLGIKPKRKAKFYISDPFIGNMRLITVSKLYEKEFKLNGIDVRKKSLVILVMTGGTQGYFYAPDEPNLCDEKLRLCWIEYIGNRRFLVNKKQYDAVKDTINNIENNLIEKYTFK